MRFDSVPRNLFLSFYLHAQFTEHHISSPYSYLLLLRLHLPFPLPHLSHTHMLLTSSPLYVWCVHTYIRFRLDNDVIRSMLPGDSPDSLIALALQCVDDDALSRPASCDVVDWLQDLYDTSPEDTVGAPVLNPLTWDSAGETSRSFAGDENIWTAINSPNNFKPPHTLPVPLPAASLKSSASSGIGNGNGMTPIKTNYDSNNNSNSSSRGSPAYFIPFSSHPPLSPVPSGGQPDAADVRTAQYITVHAYVRQNLSFLSYTIQLNTVQYNTIQYNTIQYNTIQHNTIQYNTIQYNTIQYNTIQYNTIQFIPRSLFQSGRRQGQIKSSEMKLSNQPANRYPQQFYR